MLALTVRNTAKLVREKSKAENVRLGRLFTKKDTARLMADMLDIDNEKSVYTVLDAGAGTGILSAAVIERICKSSKSCKQIILTCYENNPDFLPMLYDNLERVRKKCRHDYGVKVYSTVYEENYITEAKTHYTVTYFDAIPDKFDIVITNPPGELKEKDSEEAKSAGGVTQLKINAQFLFAKMAMQHVEDGGQLVIMLPTLFATASSLANQRKELSDNLTLSRVHLFVGKQKNLKRAIPLKKNMILAYKKGAKANEVIISTSTDDGKVVKQLSSLDYNFVVDIEDGSLTLPKSNEDIKIVKHLSKQPNTLKSLGLSMYTGLVIDNRHKGELFDTMTSGTIPIIRLSSIKGGLVNIQKSGEGAYIAPTNETVIQKNKNMIVVKRIPAKSDARFLNCGIYLASRFPEHRFISTHNKINFIASAKADSEMNVRMAFGLYALLNSTIYDRFISILSKSKQINSKEMRALPLPEKGLIESIGMRLMSMRSLDARVCDSIVNPMLGIREK